MSTKKEDLHLHATPVKRKGSRRSEDTTLEWVRADYPQLASWHTLAVKWLKGETRGLDTKLFALVAFFERYLIQQGLPHEPAAILRRDIRLPDFYKTACPDSYKGIIYNNTIRDFLQFVLLHEYGQVTNDGQTVHDLEYCNPIPRLSTSGFGSTDESVYSPLPYGYIDELRQMLASGPNFCDWKFAQSAGLADGKRAQAGWFEVPKTQIDLADPDCVWRTRDDRDQIEMWSPVRWVLLLIKLILPQSDP